MENLQSVQQAVLAEPERPAPTLTHTSASPLQRDILKVIAYFDIFRHPLTAEEIYAFLPSNSTTLDAVTTACQTTPLTSVLTCQKGYFHLSEWDSSIVEERLVKEERAKQHWKIAKLMKSLVKHFPFVRGAFISGELAKGVASENGDVDFVIVTEEDRLWVCRTLLIVFKKIFLLNSKKYFCLNHLMTTRHFIVNDRSIYTAIEMVTLKPLLNDALLAAYQQANSWTRSYLPNYATPRPSAGSVTRSFAQRISEFLFTGAFGNWLDVRLLEFWKTTWKKRYSHLSEEKRNSIFYCSRDLSTAYNGDFALKILSAYHKRLKQLGLHD